jgi:hypothetical protein
MIRPAVATALGVRLVRGRASERRQATRWPQSLSRRMAGLAVVLGFCGVIAACTLGAAPARADTPADPVLGQIDTFNVFDWGAQEDLHLAATVVYVGDDVVIYGQKGRALPAAFVSTLGDTFDDQIYPTLTEVLGPVPDPGIDGQHRIVILLYDFGDAYTVGAFRPGDVDPSASSLSSNRRDMFTLNLGRVLTDPEKAKSACAHELAHLILYNCDYLNDASPNREYEGRAARWVEEGVAMYAELACGLGAGAEEQLRSFELSSNKNLTFWTEHDKDYGASYAFMTYLSERLGSEFVRELVGQPKDGIAGIQAVLEARGSFDTFASLFDDWVIADFLDGRPPAAAPYAYGSLDVAVEPRTDEIALPWTGVETVQNYAAVYLDAPPTDPASAVRAVVDGEDRAPLHAQLVSWDSAGLVAPVVTDVPVALSAAGGTAAGPLGYDRHTLVIWARGTESVDRSYAVRFSLSADPDGVQFLDVGSDQRYFSFISTLVERDIVTGFEVPLSSGLWYFRPDDLVKRQQFAKMVVEAVGLHTEPVESLADPTFSDVSPTYTGDGEPVAYPFDYVEEAAAAGIVLGSNGLFHPADPITRIQLVRMIIRSAAAAGHPCAPYAGAETVFADVRPESPLYADAMTGYANGILSGSLDTHGLTRFLPWEPATRGQVAKMTANLLDSLDAAPSTSDPARTATGL